MKVGDLVEWKQPYGTTGRCPHAIDKAGRIGVVTDMMPQFPPSKARRRVLFPAPAGEMVVHPSVLKVLS